METTIKHERIVLVLSVLGLLFSGYLSGVKFFTETCAFNESCPNFLGYPACYFGFFMYLIIAGSAFLRALKRVDSTKANSIILWTSLIGILFAGYFTLGELPVLFRDGLTAYVLGLPTCALGLIFYVVIAVYSYKIQKYRPVSI